MSTPPPSPPSSSPAATSPSVAIPESPTSTTTNGLGPSSRLDNLLSHSPQFQASPSSGPPGSSASSSEPPLFPLDECTIPRTLVHSDSLDINDAVHIDVKNESKVLVLYTGGTIGMVRNKEGALAPQPHAMEARIRATSTMHDEAYSARRFRHVRETQLAAESATENSGGGGRLSGSKQEMLLPLVLPQVENHKRVIYTIYEYDPLLDSSNMTMDDWIQIAHDIKNAYEMFDGFVVLHGTDTLAYTASALSFMLENLGKPVIITGSQIPCFETRSDGRDNLVGALILAGNYSIPEVTVYFRHQLMRGNRTVKVSSGDLDAFHSPNMSPLVKAGIDFDVDYHSIFRPHLIEKFRVHTFLDRNVVLLRLFPSIQSDTFSHFLKPPIKGVVLQCYGAGNIPSNRKDIISSIREATDRGVLILSVTQCTHGGVSGLYETGKALLDAGVIAGMDITPEAALTKLSYVLSKDDWSQEKKRQMMQTNVCGEITVLNKETLGPAMNMKKSADDNMSDKTHPELVHAVAEAMHLNTSDELNYLREVLYPSILCSAVFKGNVKTLEDMKEFGADVAVSDYDMRTPLHIAASEGNLEMVEYLMKNGANVHVRDRNNDSPLNCAIDAGHDSVVRRLVECGAHLQMGSQELGERLTQLARQGEVRRLHCFAAAGANLSAKNRSWQTPLHAAVETGQVEVIDYLLRQGVKTTGQNVYGQTPAAIAIALKRRDILDMIKGAPVANGP